MKIEKRIISLCICALAIGATTILPIVYFSPATAQTDNPWFDIDLSYAYFNANVTDNDIFQATGGLMVDALPISSALSQQHDIEARVDFFEYTFYVNDVQLSKSFEFVGVDRPGLETPTILSTTFGHDFWSNIPWLNETLGIDHYSQNVLSIYDSPHLRSPIHSGGRYRSDITNLRPEMFQTMGFVGKLQGPVDEISDTKMAALKDTQTICLDIKRVAYITLDDKGTIITSKCNQLIQHIELTKNSNGEFTFGNTTDFIEEAISNVYGKQFIGQGYYFVGFW